jgi:hypothetical protein
VIRSRAVRGRQECAAERYLKRVHIVHPCVWVRMGGAWVVCGCLCICEFGCAMEHPQALLAIKEGCVKRVHGIHPYPPSLLQLACTAHRQLSER